MTSAEPDSSERVPIVSLRGERVALGPLPEAAISWQTGWINDFRTTRTLGAEARPRTVVQNTGWHAHMATSGETIAFSIYDLADMAPVGTVNLFDLDRAQGTCELGITIMPPERRGRGLGTDAVRLITGYAFRDLGMHNVHLKTLAFNAGGIRAYRKVGFREYGRRRQAWLHNRRRWDLIFMDITRAEWEGLHAAGKFG